MTTLVHLRLFRPVLFALLMVGTLASPSLAQQETEETEETVLSNGKQEFMSYCATCHGTDARGKGPIADFLTIRPSDLTQLRKRHNGEFPFWSVFRTIDGREEVRAHGAREMPVWGSHFLSEEGGHPLNDNIVIGRILGLVYYLRSIQEQ